MYVPKEDYLCKIGEVGDFFFIILKGSVGIYRVTSYTRLMDADEYFSILKSYYKNNDITLLNETLTSNYHIFPIKKEEFKRIDQKIYNLKYRRGLVSKRIDSTDPAFNETFELMQSKSASKIEVKEDKVKECKYFEYFEESVEEIILDKHKCTIFVEEYFLTKKKGEYLGDLALDKKGGKRNASCKAAEDCYLGILDKDDYISFIKEEKAKLRKKEIDFLIENYIFKKIAKHQFDKKFYDEFVYMDLPKNYILIKEYDDTTCVYFIKEGEVELSFSKNILQLSNLFHNLNDNYLPDFKDNFNYNIQNDPQDPTVKNFLQERRLIKIKKLCNKESLGFIELFYGFSWMYTGVVKSEKAKIYRLDIKVSI